jgi:hypothetical protein
MTAQDTSHAVLELVQRVTGAERASSPELLQGVLAADFVLVGPRGFVLTREHWLRQFRNGSMTYTSFEIRDPQIRIYGTSAIVVGTQVQSGSYQGNDASGQFRLTLVIVQEDDRWVVAGMHLSPTMDVPA